MDLSSCVGLSAMWGRQQRHAPFQPSLRSPKILKLAIAALRRWDGAIRVLAFLGFGTMLTGLFWVGAMPVAVGLFPEPLDKVVHFLTFSLFTMLLWISCLRGRPWLLVAIVAGIGALDEFHQVFLPGRSAGVDDFMADFLAAGLTALLLARYHRQPEPGHGLGRMKDKG